MVQLIIQGQKKVSSCEKKRTRPTLTLSSLIGYVDAAPERQVPGERARDGKCVQKWGGRSPGKNIGVTHILTLE